jgi:hypothetical protein
MDGVGETGDSVMAIRSKPHFTCQKFSEKGLTVFSQPCTVGLPINSLEGSYLPAGTA